MNFFSSSSCAHHVTATMSWPTFNNGDIIGRLFSHGFKLHCLLVCRPQQWLNSLQCPPSPNMLRIGECNLHQYIGNRRGVYPSIISSYLISHLVGTEATSTGTLYCWSTIDPTPSLHALLLEIPSVKIKCYQWKVSVQYMAIYVTNALV